MLNDYFFWFAQPSSILNNYDIAAGWIFAGLIGLGIVGWMAKKFAVKHDVTRKLFSRWITAMVWTGIIGIIWFGFRYESVPIFSKRIWAGGILAFGLIWLGWVLWYLAFRYPAEKKDHDYNSVKSKYISGQR